MMMLYAAVGQWMVQLGLTGGFRDAAALPARSGGGIPPSSATFHATPLDLCVVGRLLVRGGPFKGGSGICLDGPRSASGCRHGTVVIITPLVRSGARTYARSMHSFRSLISIFYVYTSFNYKEVFNNYAIQRISIECQLLDDMDYILVLSVAVDAGVLMYCVVWHAVCRVLPCSSPQYGNLCSDEG